MLPSEESGTEPTRPMTETTADTGTTARKDLGSDENFFPSTEEPSLGDLIVGRVTSTSDLKVA